jgi:hypothetical protein
VQSNADEKFPAGRGCKRRVRLTGLKQCQADPTSCQSTNKQTTQFSSHHRSNIHRTSGTAPSPSLVQHPRPNTLRLRRTERGGATRAFCHLHVRVTTTRVLPSPRRQFRGPRSGGRSRPLVGLCTAASSLPDVGEPTMASSPSVDRLSLR